MTPRYRKRKWPAPNLAGHLVYRGVVASWNGLRREARERLPHVSVPQPFQRPIAQLPHPLARHAEHAADLLARVLATAVQAGIQSQHLAVAPLQRAQRLLDLVRQRSEERRVGKECRSRWSPY